MIIVQMSGGLGNQMFQYALYRQLQEMGKEVKIDDQSNYVATDARSKQLNKAFGIAYEQASKQEIIKLTDASMLPWVRVRRKLLGRRSHSFVENNPNFIEEVMTMEPAYLEGWWQNEKYFKDIAPILRKEFQFTQTIPLKCQQYLERIRNTKGQSVSMHIRRGDYLSDQFKDMYGGICTDAYYEKAMQMMKEKYGNVTFYIFSNDAAWAKDKYKGEEFVVVEGNDEDAGFLDLFLMSNCQHNIIANSSFSWWGAWLNQNPNKTVIAPKVWINGKDYRDIYSDWMLAI